MVSVLHDLFAWAPIGLPAFIFLITLVVFFHELGHFLVARACGVAVETFSIGFGSEMFMVSIFMVVTYIYCHSLTIDNLIHWH